MTTTMSDFCGSSVDEWFDWILKQPTADNPGRKSFTIELKYLTSILNWYRNYKNDQFIVPIVKKHRDRAKFKKVKPRRKDYFIRPEDIGKWVRWLQEHRKDPLYYRLGRFMLQAGTRIGEACGLCWDSVDLDRGEVEITRTMAWDHSTRAPYLVERVKTEDSYGIVHLSDDLIELLTEMRSQRSAAGLVFLNIKGAMPKYNAIVSAFNAGFRALDLPWSATHICRHTHGSIGLKANNGNIAKVQATLRHGDRATTEKYAKAIACLDRSAVQNASQMMGFSQGSCEEKWRKQTSLPPSLPKSLPLDSGSLEGHPFSETSSKAIAGQD